MSNSAFSQNSVTNPLPATQGGTGVGTNTTGSVLVGAGTSPIVSSPMIVDGSTGAAAGFRTTFNNQTGTTYTFLATDTGKTVTLTNAASITATLPNNLAIGWTCEVIQGGAGQVTFSAASGATLQNRSSFTKIAGLYGAARLVVVTNAGGTSAVYNLAGDGA